MEGEWKAYCIGSEGFQIRPNWEGTPVTIIKQDLRKYRTPIVKEMGGSFEEQKVNAELIVKAVNSYTTMVEALKVILIESDKGEYKDTAPIARAHFKVQQALAQARRE